MDMPSAGATASEDGTQRGEDVIPLTGVLPDSLRQRIGSDVTPNNAHVRAHAQEDERDQPPVIHFAVEVNPPWFITLCCALQQMLATVGGPIYVVNVIHSNICATGNDVVLAEMISIAIFMCGVCTFLQVTFGIRLPIVQGSSVSFIAPILSLMSSPEWRCPPTPGLNGTYLASFNATANLTEAGEHEEAWKPRLREISGALIVASLVQVFLGASGLIGFLLRFIGPLTIVPTVALIGISLFETVTAMCESQWGIAMLTAGLVLIYSQFLGRLNIPFPSYSSTSKCTTVRYPFFKLFPHILAIFTVWLVSYVLTVADVFPSDPRSPGYRARTDAKVDAIYSAKWLFIPYPGMWGAPTFRTGLVVGMTAGVLCSMIESVGDYYVAARMCSVRAPPKHAVNRGVAVEGMGGVLCGLLYNGHGTTSYSDTVGYIGITGVASRVVWQVMGILFMLFGLFGKFGAALSLVPDPIIGGAMIICNGMVFMVGMSNLQFTNMRSARNMMILAIAFMLGMMLPFWLRDNPAAINTGVVTLDLVLNAVLGTGMFVGAFVGFVLDNLVPGTEAERGIRAMHEYVGITDHHEVDDLVPAEVVHEVSQKPPDTLYDVPLISKVVRRLKICSYVPFLPSYVERPFKIKVEK